MADKKTHLNLKVSPQLKNELEKIAAKERRSLANLSELLLEWSVEQLHLAGSTIALLSKPESGTDSLQRTPSDRELIERQTNIAKGVYEDHTQPEQPKVKRGRLKTA